MSVTSHRVFSTVVAAVLGFALLSGCSSPEEQAKAYYERGLKLVEQGEPVKAGLEFRNALKIKDDYIPAIYALGQVEEQQEHFDNAAKLFLNITERDSAHVQARVRLASLLIAANQLDDSLKFVDQAYALAPTDPSVLTLKGTVALKLDNRGDAVRFADAALKSDPNYTDAFVVLASERFLNSDPKGALTLLNRGLHGNEGNVGLQLFRMKAFEALQDQAGVEAVFASLIKYYPDNANFRNGLTHWYLQAGRKDDAEKVLRQFVADQPDNVQAELNLVALLKEQKGSAAAKAELLSRIGKKGGNAFDYRLELAQLTYRDGNYVEADALMQKLITDSRDDSAERNIARIQLARMMVSRGDVSEAGKLVETTLTDDAKNVDALTLRAAIRSSQGKNADAIEDLLAALNEAPQSGRIMELLAEAYERNGAVTLAGEQYAKATSIDQFKPDTGLKYAQFLLRYAKLDQADRVLTEISSAEPDNREVLALRAKVKLAKQDWLGAQKLSASLRELATPDEGAADQILAAALAGEKKYDESVKVLEDASRGTKGGTSSVAALAALVDGYLKAGEPKKAEESLKSILSSDPNNVHAQVLLGRVYEFTKKPDEAEASFKTAIEKNPTAAVGYAALGEFYGNNNRFEQAEKTLREGLKQHPDDNALRLLLAMSLEGSKQYDAAIVEYEAIFAADPRSVIVANNLASLLSERGDPTSVDRAYTIASRFADSDVPQLLDTLGWIDYLKGEYDQALLLLKKAAEKLPNTGVVQYHLALTYKEVGQTEAAIATLKKAIELLPQEHPESSKARAALDQLSSADKAPDHTKSN